MVLPIEQIPYTYVGYGTDDICNFTPTGTFDVFTFILTDTQGQPFYVFDRVNGHLYTYDDLNERLEFVDDLPDEFYFWDFSFFDLSQLCKIYLVSCGTFIDTKCDFFKRGTVNEIIVGAQCDLPLASDNGGLFMTDESTGIVYLSDGTSWLFDDNRSNNFANYWDGDSIINKEPCSNPLSRPKEPFKMLDLTNRRMYVFDGTDYIRIDYDAAGVPSIV